MVGVIDMRILFLDFDGVLNNQGSFIYETRRRDEWEDPTATGPVNESLCPICCSNLIYILEHVTDVKIVISSTWRELFSLDWLKEKLQSYHIDSSLVIDVTPQTVSGHRNREVHMWLDSHPEVTEYVIVDDNLYDGLDLNKGNFVQTHWHEGLTFAKAIDIIVLFDKQYWENH
jgi:hypothetical protein